MNLKLSQRRWLLISLTLLFTGAASAFFIRALVSGPLDVIDVIAGIVFVIIMLAGSFNFLLYLFGFFLPRSSPTLNGIADLITTRTALVMPLYHEDMDRVYLGVRQTWLSVKEAGLESHCDFYLLCDSTEAQKCAEEDRYYSKLLSEFDHPKADGGTLFLVRREERKKYKAGNIAHFLTRHGGIYDFMVVLDADSVMLGETIKRLIQEMQHRVNVAVMQTTIVPIRASTIFARMMQFGCSRCMPIFGCGLHWFLGRDSVYWGHNAIIRIAPFMAHCNLPVMPGNPPLGGDIMSQDIVEAALLGRAGWRVEWDTRPFGSFDEMPANIVAYGQRDRRWCQGNFQHFWLIFGDRIRWGHRLYFATGIMAYASSPLLLVLLGLGFIQGLRGRVYTLDPLTLVSFLTFFLSMLLIPKILGFVLQIRKGAKPVRELLSTILEVVLNTLISPSLLYLHTCFVLGILSGKRIQWKHQSRDPDEGLQWSTALRLFWLPTIAGTVWLAVAAEKTPGFLIFLAPILTGWILSIPLAVGTANKSVSRFLSQQHLLDDCLSSEERQALGPLSAGREAPKNLDPQRDLVQASELD